MAKLDPLVAAVTAYVAAQWTSDDWRQFGRETGTSDILSNHPRLYRSLDFSDPDYPEAAAEVLERVLREAVEKDSGEKGRMDLLADWMPELPRWIADHAPYRTKKLFGEYIAARALPEIPEEWVSSHYVNAEPVSATEVGSPANGPQSPVTPHGPSQLGSASGLVAGDSAPGAPDSEERAIPTDIFIVHGHDEAARDSIRIYVHELTGIMPTSLAELPGRGDTIIEKFEKIGGNASYVIVLLTPDDVGHTVGAHEAGSPPNPRARQNVVLELGYFIGKIGRVNVVVLDADVERPSDLAGLSYVRYPGLNWKDELRKELKGAGLTT